MAVRYVHNRRTRRYILRVQPDGTVRATVPRAGSLREAKAFVARHAAWIARQLRQRSSQPPLPPVAWEQGTLVLYRGQPVPLQVVSAGAGVVISLGDQSWPAAGAGNLRGQVEARLWWLASAELPGLTMRLANQHGIAVRRITVRNQRSRWGSSSRRGTISLNWRLIQAPGFVQGYIVIHELMHQREMNHSRRFWQHVAAACPDHRQAEAWLKQHRGLLR